MVSKDFLKQISASFIAVICWESLVFLLKRATKLKDMDHAGITNFWFILFFVSINVLSFCFLKRKAAKDKRNTSLLQDKETISIDARETIISELSLEIDHNLKLLHDFWGKIGISSTEKPMTLAQALNKSQRVVAEEPSSKTIHTIRKDYYLTEPPVWHRKIFDKPTSLIVLSEKKKQGARQFYDKLIAITSTYEKLRTSKGATIIGELKNNLEIIITELLNQRNPLEKT